MSHKVGKRKDIKGSGEIISYYMGNTCWPWGKHIGRPIDYEISVYKVDNPVQSSLLSSLVFNPNIRFLFIDLL